MFGFRFSLLGRKDGKLIAQSALERGPRFAAFLIAGEIGKLGDDVGVVQKPEDRHNYEVSNREAIPFEPLLLTQPIGYSLELQPRKLFSARPPQLRPVLFGMEDRDGKDVEDRRFETVEPSVRPLDCTELGLAFPWQQRFALLTDVLHDRTRFEDADLLVPIARYLVERLLLGVLGGTRRAKQADSIIKTDFFEGPTHTQVTNKAPGKIGRRLEGGNLDRCIRIDGHSFLLAKGRENRTSSVRTDPRPKRIRPQNLFSGLCRRRDMDTRMASKASNGEHDFTARLVGLRPALHRFAARMVGSALDGEDVVQEAIARAIGALNRAPPDGDAAPWLFRITHNAAIDFIRSRERHRVERDVVDDDIVSDADDAARRLATRAAMSAFLRLPPSQRGAVILKDVLGHSNEEVAVILGTTLAASKAALHRGRAQLQVHSDAAPRMSKPSADELARVQSYVDRFNDRDFDAIRAMLADDVQFDLVARMQGGRSSFETYFTRYEQMTAWRLSIGWVDGRLAVVVTDPEDPLASPFSMIVIDWAADRIVRVRDFYHAPYVLEGAAISVLDGT